MTHTLKRAAVLMLALIFLATPPDVGNAGTTYYLAPHGTGSESADAGTSRDNRVCIEVFRDTIASAGDEGLCDHGSYGNFTLAGKLGTNPGTAGNHVIYRADPATCTPRSADWWSRESKLETPDPNKHPVFGRITINPWETPVGNYNAAVPYYITLDGLWIDQAYIFLYLSVSDVNIVNCNIFARLADKDSACDAYCIGSYYYASGSDYRNIEIEDCYLFGARSSIYLAGKYNGGVKVTNCHMYSNGSGIAYMPQTTVVGDPVVFTHCNMHYQAMVGEYLDPGVLTHTVATVDESYPRRKFTIDSAASPCVWADVNDADTGTLDYRYVSAKNAAGTSFELASDVTFDIEVGDKVRFTDGIHGSGIAIRHGDVTFDGCQLHEMGASRAIYVYTDVPGPFDNLHFLNCLVYDSLNMYTWDMLDGSTSRVGDNLWIINCTVVGNRWHTTYLDQLDAWAKSYTTLHQAKYRYGHAIEFGFAPTTDKSTARIANNLFIGQVSGGDLGDAVRRNNVLYFSTTTSPWSADATNLNDANNVTIYGNEEFGSEPAPFDAAGTYFVAANEDFDDVYTTLWLTDNLYSDFMLKLGAPAIDAGDSEFAPAACISGGLRVDPPDIGAWEYGATSPSAPTAASSPSPTNGKTLVRETADLSWTTGANSPTHHVFFSTDLQDVTDGTGTADKGTQAGTTYDPGTMANNTTYYWRIQEENDDGHADGTVWSFQTRPPPTPKYGLIGRKGKK